MNDQSFKAENNFGSSNEMSIKFTAGTGSGTVNVFPAPGAGSAANATLPGNVTYTGDFATYADLVDYLKTNKLAISYIRLQTNNTANFSNTMELGEVKPNRQNNAIQVLDLSEFRESTGNGFADTLTIPASKLGGGIVLRAATYAKFIGLLEASYIKVIFGVVAWDSKVELKPIS